jgi:hypothetical protein
VFTLVSCLLAACNLPAIGDSPTAPVQGDAATLKGDVAMNKGDTIARASVTLDAGNPASNSSSTTMRIVDDQQSTDDDEDRVDDSDDDIGDDSDDSGDGSDDTDDSGDGDDDDNSHDDSVTSVGLSVDDSDGTSPAAAGGFRGVDDTWQYMEFTDTRCRLGGKAGISVNLHANSDRVMIYLAGGGSCFDVQSCDTNRRQIGVEVEDPNNYVDAARTPGNNGLFDRGKSENPVKDWNFVFVPYCSGDIHAGAQPNGQVPGVDGVHQFVGRSNLSVFLKRLVPMFASAQQVLLTGSSAGGFGASANWSFVQREFGAIPVTMIDDSGPLLSQNYAPKCLADSQLKIWGLAQGALADCGAACTGDDYALKLLDYSAKRAKAPGGLISSDSDDMIRRFLGIGTNNGANNCMGNLVWTPMPAADFQAGLLAYRERAKGYPNFGTFFPSSSEHTWLASDSLYSASAGDLKLVDWIRGILQGKTAVHAGG